MSSAIQLNATLSLINGHGLAPNINTVVQIQTMQSQATLKLWKTIFTNCNANAVVAQTIYPLLNSIGTGISSGEFLLDLYPNSVRPVSTPGANIANPSANGVAYYGGMASFSQTLLNQVNGPFMYGVAGFANVYSQARGYAALTFDAIGSANILQHQTFGQTGIHSTGVVDLATGGVGANAPLLANVVQNWGTMYDVTQVNLIADPYVFGQNLLNQGLGTVGNLSANIAATGLNVSNITIMPTSTVTTTPAVTKQSVTSTDSLVGTFILPNVSNTVTTTTVSGNNPAVVVKIYNSVTGANLQQIVSATKFSTKNNKWQTLADFLVLSKVVDPSLLNNLAGLGINSLSDFGAYLKSRLGNKTFNSWAEMSAFLSSVQIPTLTHTPTTASSSPVLSSLVQSALQGITGLGTGDYGNFTATDLLGACAGNVYYSGYQTLNNYYGSLVGPTNAAMTALNSAVTSTTSSYLSAVAAAAVAGTPNTATITVNTSAVIAAITALQSAVNSTSGANFTTCQTAYYSMVNKLNREVNNLAAAGASFAASPGTTLIGFGSAIGSIGGKDLSGFRSDIFLANLITNDVYGDTIRSAIAENNNNLSYANDAKPLQALNGAANQKIPLSTYLSQNK